MVRKGCLHGLACALKVLGAKAPKKQRTVAEDASEILEASHYQDLPKGSVGVTGKKTGRDRERERERERQ